MKLSHLTVIFIIITVPIILLVSLYITTGLKTIKYQSLYDTGLLTATHDALYAFDKNTINSTYSDNAETKRNILKSSVKAFEKSLCNTCGISSYNTDEIEEYIPALFFGMYDGFYMYAPSYNSKSGKYEHDLKNYVYYSEMLDDGTSIIYSLDNYVIVSGRFGTDGRYIIKEGYLIDVDNINTAKTPFEYKCKNNKGKDVIIQIDMSDNDAVNYYKEAKEFSTWFRNNVEKKSDCPEYLKITSRDDNDPEDENSAFVKNKREIIKKKIEEVLNSTITAYSERTLGQNYKMPKLSAEDWEKVYNNISMISFFQGKQIGFTKYNGYCVLNSTNSKEYVNPNLMYFINENDYHDIRCSDLRSIESYIKGYKIGNFSKRKVESIDQNTGETTINNQYDYEEYACYNCINGQINYGITGYQTVYDYVRNTENSNIKKSYFTSLARERYNQVKLIDSNKHYLVDVNQVIDGVTYYNLKYEDNNYGCLFYPSINGERVFDFKYPDYSQQKSPYGSTFTLEKIVVRENTEYEIQYAYVGSINNFEITKRKVELKKNGNEFELDCIITEDTRIDLILSSSYQVSFDPNGGTCSTPSIDFIHNQIYGDLPTPTREGYRFEGWYTSKSGGDKITSETTVSKTGNHTLYAHWEQLYCVDVNQIINGVEHSDASNIVGACTFNPYVDNIDVYNGVSGQDYWQQKSVYGSTFSLKNIKFKDNGYKLIAININGTSVSISELEKNADNSFNLNITIKEDTKIKMYIVKECKVEYNSNGGTGTMEDSYVTYGEDFLTNQNKFTRTGYTFAGWNEKADGTGTAWTLNSYGVYESDMGYWNWEYTEDITLYAQWTINLYTVDVNVIIDHEEYFYGVDDYRFSVRINNDIVAYKVRDFCQEVEYGSVVSIIVYGNYDYLFYGVDPDNVEIEKDTTINIYIGGR